jgi:hypothetical protein
MFLSLRLAALTSSVLSLISHVHGLTIPYPIGARDSAQLCNGYADLCDRSYGNITFLGAHDSFAASGNPFALARTQVVDVVTQLMLGVRALQLQVHMNHHQLHVCHNTCGLFDGGTLEDYLMKVKSFLDKHPNEVLTLIIANPESVSAADVWQPIFENTGLEQMAYVPPQALMTRDDWPTLIQMLDSQRRVVVFMDKGTNDTVPYILPQFDLMWEDEYDPANSSFPCAVDRTSGALPSEQQLNLINHNLNYEILPFGLHGFRIPNWLVSVWTNSVSSIMSHADHCASYAGGKRPNFVLTDFVNVGQAIAAVARLNGLSY